MAIQFVGGSGASANATGYYSLSTTSLTGGIASSAAIGDFIIAITGFAGNPATNPDALTGIVSSWTKGAVITTTSSVAAVKARVVYGFVTSAGNIVYFQGVGSSATLFYVFRGVDTTSPLDVALATATGTGSGLDSPAITTATADAQVVIGGFIGLPSGSTATTTTAPTGYGNGLIAPGNIFAPQGFRARINRRSILLPAGTLEDPGIPTTTTEPTATWIGFTAALRAAGAVVAGGNAKVWNGSAWVAKPVKVWNGSAWVTKPVKRWNGTAWVTTTY